MKTKSKIFSTPMVQAILEGRKTQFREVIKESYNGCWTNGGPHPCPNEPVFVKLGDVLEYPFEDGTIMTVGKTEAYFHCSTLESIAYPKYELGDIIYVREAWQHTAHLGLRPDNEDYGYVYRADGSEWEDMEGWCWISPATMPREAARIFLEVLDVRVERLNDISEQDAVAEGVGNIPIEIAPSPYNDWGGDLDYGYVDYQNLGEFAGYLGDAGAFRQAKDSFASLWESINGRGSWDNKWVFSYTFKRIEKP